MSRNRFLETLNSTELRRLLDEIPPDLQVDVVQFALDLAGVVNPVADAANALISLLRGDLFGAAISTVSIIPGRDVVKAAKFDRYRKSIIRLVNLARKNPKLARILEVSLRQVHDSVGRGLEALAKHADQVSLTARQELQGIQNELNSYFNHLRNLKLLAGHTAAHIARLKGVSSGQFAIRRGDKLITANVDAVVDLLEEGAQKGRHPAIRKDANELLERMAMSDTYRVSAGPHAKGDPGSTTLDATRHITIEIKDESFHMHMDKRGHLFQITDKSGRGLSGIPAHVAPGVPIE